MLIKVKVTNRQCDVRNSTRKNTENRNRLESVCFMCIHITETVGLPAGVDNFY